jgi:cysteine desulfurase
MTQRAVYLDHAATTPLDPRVLEAMLPYFSDRFGNPSSIHRVGRQSLDALDEARDSVAAILGTNAKEIVFTSGGSEADNLAIKGVALAQRQAGRGAHIISCVTEHHAVLHPLEFLADFGFEVTLLPVDQDGLVNPADLRTALRSDTVLVSIMYGNNEIGTVQPITELAAICRERGVPFHTDAVQAPGALPLQVRELGVDLMTLAAHKFYGPKGVGVLYVRRGTPLSPQLNGGGQERRRRAGTENVAGIVGLAAALRYAEAERVEQVARITALRDRLWDGIKANVPYVSLNGHASQRLPNNLNVTIDFIEGESILLLLDQHGIAASSGSACSSGSLEASHVLLALGLPSERAIGAVRFSLGTSTTSDDIDYVIDTLPPLVERLRSVSPVYRELHDERLAVQEV